ncbi:MAG: YecA family protein [Acidobacteria bacterium]|nr:MAG: YecA family protein [Acidobacteriota bacterium]
MKVLKNSPLTDAELDRLDDFLANCKDGDAMNLEELDGFFAALIAGAETVMPSEYYPEVFGGDFADTCVFNSLEEVNEILGLLMRHWNTIAGALFNGEPRIPLLATDEDGVAHGNDWAIGFMRGMDMRHDSWAELVNDEEHGGWLLPMLILYHEHDEDPEMRPEPISPEQREKIIVGMGAGLMKAYEYFRARRERNAAVAGTELRQKTGRNDPCPCGSGKKYKKCCGGATVN